MERNCNNCTHMHKGIEIRLSTSTKTTDFCALDRPLEIKRGITKCEEYKPTLLQRIREKL